VPYTSAQDFAKGKNEPPFLTNWPPARIWRSEPGRRARVPGGGSRQRDW